MKKSLLFLWFVVPFLGLNLAACSDDDNPGGPGDGGDVVEEPVDELAVLQSSLAKVDESGNLQERILGVPLDPADETEVSVGVDNFEEAQFLFLSLFADTTRISSDNMEATFSCAEGSARLVQQTDDNGLVGYATFNVPGLKYVSKIDFIKNSAWPDNASGKGFHKLGVQYEYKAWTGDPTPAATDDFNKDELHTFVCVREYSNGKPALLVGISKDDWYIYWRYSNEYSGNIPDKGKAQEISEILRTNWNTYKQFFNANGKNLLNDGWEYWINSGKDYGVAVYRDAIKLQTGSVSRYDVHYKTPRKRVLFYLESGQKE